MTAVVDKSQLRGAYRLMRLLVDDRSLNELSFSGE
jgi:hypothetical protein